MLICFLLTHVPNPRMNKRIEALKKIADVRVICTRRASQNLWEPKQNVDHIVFDIDLPSARHIVKRFIVSQDFQKKALEKLTEFKPDVIYAEWLDTLIIADKYKKTHNVEIVFEVADLRENYIVKPKRIMERIITALLLYREKKVFKNVDFLVVTSPKFYDLHYSSLISKDKMLFVPNTPNTDAFQTYSKKRDGDFTIGFIGGIRYLKQMKILVDAAEKASCRILFAGSGFSVSDYEEIQAYCKGKEFVRFTGRYDYDKQIAELYGMVDCVFAVYDADNPNVKIALPNKLYESVLCELPIIVARGTYLEELVNEWGVGVAVDYRTPDELTSVLKKLSQDKSYLDSFAAKCRENQDKVNLEFYNNKLVDFIETMSNGK